MKVLRRMASRYAALVGIGGLVLAACQPAPAVPPTPAPPTAAPAKPAASPAVASPAVAPAPSPSPSPAAKPAVSPVPSPSPVVAAASPSPAVGRVIEIVATDFAFAAPDTVQSGLATIRLRNSGAEPHHVQLMRLNTGVTLQQFTAALAGGPEAIAGLGGFEGGVGALSGNGTGEVILDLKDGQYMLLCFVQSPDGVPHIAKGMVKPMTVSAGGPTVAAPTTAGTIDMKDFSFELPSSITGRGSIYRVTNAGPQPHEIVLLRAAEGRRAQDVMQFFSAPPSGPPPIQSFVGGMQGLNATGAGFWVNSLTPGSYVAICLIPDPGSGRPHAALGMVADVTVQ